MDKIAWFLMAFYVLYSYGYVFAILAELLASKDVEEMSKGEAAAYFMAFILSPIFCPMFAGAKEAGK